MKRKIIFIILIIVILQYFCVFVFADNSLTNDIANEVTNSIPAELEKQKEEVDNKIEDANVKLEYVQGELSDTLLKVQETEDKIRQYESEITELADKMQTLQTSIDEATQKLQIASQNYEEKSDLLARRLVAIYEAGDAQYLDILLKSKSVTDFISRSYMIQEIAEYDGILINQIEEEKNNIETTKQKLENEQSEIRIIKAKSEQTTIVLNNMQTLQKSYISKLSDSEKILQQQLTEYKKEQQSSAA